MGLNMYGFGALPLSAYGNNVAVPGKVQLVVRTVTKRHPWLGLHKPADPANPARWEQVADRSAAAAKNIKDKVVLADMQRFALHRSTDMLLTEMTHRDQALLRQERMAIEASFNGMAIVHAIRQAVKLVHDRFTEKSINSILQAANELASAIANKQPNVLVLANAANTTLSKLNMAVNPAGSAAAYPQVEALATFSNEIYRQMIAAFNARGIVHAIRQAVGLLPDGFPKAQINRALQAAANLEKAIANKRPDILDFMSAANTALQNLNTAVDAVADTKPQIAAFAVSSDEIYRLMNAANNHIRDIFANPGPIIDQVMGALIKEYNDIAAKPEAARTAQDKTRFEELKKYLGSDQLWNKVPDYKNNENYKAIIVGNLIPDNFPAIFFQNQHAEYLIELLDRYNQLVETRNNAGGFDKLNPALQRELSDCFARLQHIYQDGIDGRDQEPFNNFAAEFAAGAKTHEACSAVAFKPEQIRQESARLQNRDPYHFTLPSFRADYSKRFDAVLYDKALDWFAVQVERDCLLPQLPRAQQRQDALYQAQKNALLAAKPEIEAMHEKLRNIQVIAEAYYGDLVIDPMLQASQRNLFDLYNTAHPRKKVGNPKFDLPRTPQQIAEFGLVLAWHLEKDEADTLRTGLNQAKSNVNNLDISTNPHLGDYKSNLLDGLAEVWNETSRYIQLLKQERDAKRDDKVAAEQAVNAQRAKLQFGQNTWNQNLNETIANCDAIFQNMQNEFQQEFGRQTRTRLKKALQHANSVDELSYSVNQVDAAECLQATRTAMEANQTRLHTQLKADAKKTTADFFNETTAAVKVSCTKHKDVLQDDVKLLKALAVDADITNLNLEDPNLDINRRTLNWILFDPRSIDDDLVERLLTAIHEDVEIVDDQLNKIRRAHIREALLLQIRTGGQAKFLINYREGAKQALEKLAQDIPGFEAAVTDAEQEFNIAEARLKKAENQHRNWDASIRDLLEADQQIPLDVANLQSIQGLVDAAHAAAGELPGLIRQERVAQDVKRDIEEQLQQIEVEQRALAALSPANIANPARIVLNFAEVQINLWKNAVARLRTKAIALNREVAQLRDLRAARAGDADQIVPNDEYEQIELREINNSISSTEQIDQRIREAVRQQLECAVTIGTITQAQMALFDEDDLCNVGESSDQVNSILELLCENPVPINVDPIEINDATTIENIRDHYQTRDADPQSLQEADTQAVTNAKAAMDGAILAEQNRLREIPEQADINRINDDIAERRTTITDNLTQAFQHCDNAKVHLEGIRDNLNPQIDTIQREIDNLDQNYTNLPLDEKNQYREALVAHQNKLQGFLRTAHAQANALALNREALEDLINIDHKADFVSRAAIKNLDIKIAAINQLQVNINAAVGPVGQITAARDAIDIDAVRDEQRRCQRELDATKAKLKEAQADHDLLIGEAGRRNISGNADKQKAVADAIPKTLVNNTAEQARRLLTWGAETRELANATARLQQSQSDEERMKKAAGNFGGEIQKVKNNVPAILDNEAKFTREVTRELFHFNRDSFTTSIRKITRELWHFPEDSAVYKVTDNIHLLDIPVVANEKTKSRSDRVYDLVSMYVHRLGLLKPEDEKLKINIYGMMGNKDERALAITIKALIDTRYSDVLSTTGIYYSDFNDAEKKFYQEMKKEFNRKITTAIMDVAVPTLGKELSETIVLPRVGR